MRRYNTVRWLLGVVVLLLVLQGVFAQEAPPPPPVLPPAIQPQDAAVAGKAILPAQDKAAIIRLNAGVDDMMRRSVERRVDIARKAGCTVVIFEVDTYGGAITSGREISLLIKKLPADSRMATVAWVHNKAISAGVFLTSACQHTVMSRDSIMGDCVPIWISEKGELVIKEGDERKKMQQPVLDEFKDSAKVNHLNYTLLKAMVVPQVEIWEVRNSDTGETRFVDKAEKDTLLKPVPGVNKESPWQIVPQDGRIGPVDSEDQVLEVRPEMAIRMGLSEATIDNVDQLRSVLNVHGEIIALDYSFAEMATVWLTDPWVRGMLFFAMLVLAWIEFSHPGVSVPGILAVICLLLLVGAPFLTGLAQVWEIVLIVVGLGIIVTDLVVFGGIGLLAVPGFILMAIGLVASFVPMEPGGFGMQSTWTALRNGMMVVVFGSIAAIATFFLLSKYLYMTPGFRRLQLAPTTGGTATNEPELRDAADRPADEAVFIGAVGKAATDLRPAGKARFGDHLVDVASYGSFIERDSEVEVVEISGRVVVRPRKA